jgi:glycosyltransferase involved in cell wall biosynthesis
MSDYPLVSVVTPVFNIGRFLGETIRSVQAQDYPALEHIVIDSGSTDNTGEVLAEHSSFVKPIWDGPKTQTSKLNIGFDAANGEIIGWLSGDDLYLPGVVRQAVEELQRHPTAAMVYADHIEVDEEGRELGRVESAPFDLDRLINVGNLVAFGTVFMRADVIRELGGVDERYEYAPDYELWIRIGKRFPVRRVNEPWVAYRRHGGQQMTVSSPRVGRAIRQASRRHGGRYFSEVGFTHSKPLRALRLLRRRDFRGMGRGLVRNAAQLAGRSAAR